MPIVTSFAFALSVAAVALAQDEGYPDGTLVPEVDLGLQQTPLIVPEAFRGAVPQDLVLNLPPGFSAHVFAHEGLRKPRFMAFDPNGVLHVANMGASQIVALPDRNRDGVADERIVSLRGLREAHSLLFYKDALYVAEEHQVIRVRDTDDDLIYEQEEVILPDVPWKGWHDTRTLVVDRHNDKMYLSVGSPCDLCRMDEGFQVVGNTNNSVPHHPERGTILQFNPDGSDRRIFATGIRHVIGMDFHPQTNALWANHNGHDLEGRTRPPEWIDIIGDQDFMGYPLVHSHQVWSDFTIDGYEKVLPITHADSLLVATQKRPVALVPAHYAPMGLHFYTGDLFPPRYHNAAFVAFRAGKAKLSSHPGYL
ncbi:MAG: PQQ-dependent sugar dehydrogenase, partial [Gemmatimonadetes bacterium]|nr:PQQ-dependent sugar dehydrogenase [Gemmatimonadota bacterium]